MILKMLICCLGSTPVVRLDPSPLPLDESDAIDAHLKEVTMQGAVFVTRLEHHCGYSFVYS